MGDTTFTNGIAPTFWPMNLDPAMDPSASNNEPTQPGTSNTQHSGAGAAQNGFGSVFMGST